jgi:phosphopantetheinyl transferase
MVLSERLKAAPADLRLGRTDAGKPTIQGLHFNVSHSGDLILLGARTLEGLNLRVEPREKRLVDAGPAPAAAA